MEVVSCTCGLWGGNPVQIKDCRLGVHFIFSLKSGWLQIIFRAFWESSSAFPLLLPAHKPGPGRAASCLIHFSCKQLLHPLLLPQPEDWKLPFYIFPMVGKDLCIHMTIAKSKNLTQALISVTGFITAMGRRLIKETNVWNQWASQLPSSKRRIKTKGCVICSQEESPKEPKISSLLDQDRMK